MPDMQHKIWSS